MIQSEEVPPHHGKMNFAMINWTWKSKNALKKTVDASRIRIPQELGTSETATTLGSEESDVEKAIFQKLDSTSTIDVQITWNVRRSAQLVENA